ncbi:MAG: TfoX/Sxy family protein [Polaromonas sp.]|nr:TfoX/Sxy family protein [Polaromonas sp.]
MSEFVAGLHEVFERLGRIEARRMFGGHGIFFDGRMIGLVVKDTLYLKVDGESAAHFDAIDAPAFTYQRQGKATQLSYREAPADIFDDRDIAALWGRRAWEAAMRSGQAAKVHKPRPVAPPRKTRIAKKT